MMQLPEDSEWQASRQSWELPYSEKLNIPALQRIFDKTSASYKYLYFLSLLDILQETGFNRLHISFDEILLEMLANAWYPHQYFKLNFGSNDRIAQELDRLGVKELEVGTVSKSKSRLKQQLAKRDYRNNSLLNMVPYRLQTPFFSKELNDLKDQNRNKRIVELAHRHFDTIKPLYIYNQEGSGIIMNPQWMLYLFENQQMVRSFICWNWLDYMQRRNPSVPNLQKKLFPPISRNNLTMQTGYWKFILEREALRCIFSHQPISQEDLSLDHFLPWSFVAHDQLWNLIPVSRSINSSKSSSLPSLDVYLDKLVDLQYQGLRCYYDYGEKKSWKNICQPFVEDLKLKEEELLNRGLLGKAFKRVMEPLSSLAAAQGFDEGWRF